MSTDGFHVHRPHAHAVEQAAHCKDELLGKLAVTTAILVTALSRPAMKPY